MNISFEDSALEELYSSGTTKDRKYNQKDFLKAKSWIFKNTIKSDNLWQDGSRKRIKEANKHIRNFQRFFKIMNNLMPVNMITQMKDLIKK